jgi:hypothetical protein
LLVKRSDLASGVKAFGLQRLERIDEPGVVVVKERAVARQKPDLGARFEGSLYKLVSGRRLENSDVSIHFRFGNFKRAFREVSISFFQTAI